MSDLDFWDDYDPEEEDWMDGLPSPSPNPESVVSGELSSILQSLGIGDYDEVVIDFSKVDKPEDIRGLRFPTLEDAIRFLVKIGVVTFSNVVDLGDDGYGVIIGDSK